MAITVTNKGANSATTGSGPYTATLLSAPTANRVQLAFIVNSVNSNGPPAQPVLTSTGLTWTAIAGVNFATPSTMLRRLTVYRAYGAAPSGTSVTITIANGINGGTPTGAAWSFCELTGVDNTGVGGVNAIADSAVVASTSTGTTLTTLDLGGIVFTGDAVIAGWGLDTASLVTPAEGFTEISEATFSSPTARVQSQYHLTYDTTPTATWTTSNSAGIALELKTLENAFKSNPKPGETVTLSDTLTNIVLISAPLAISTPAETVALSDDAIVQRWETTWLGTVDLLNMPQGVDSVTLTDTLTDLQFPGTPQPNVNDAVTLTDTPTIKGLTIPIPVADLMTVSENPPVLLLISGGVWQILRAESVTLTDTPTVNAVLAPSTADVQGMTDTPMVVVIYEPKAADTVSLTDTLAVQLLAQPHAAETVTLSDTPTLIGLTLLIPGPAESLSVTDAPNVVRSGIIPVENFDDNVTNTGLWTVEATRTTTDALVLVSETSHQLQITPRTNAGSVDAYNGYREIDAQNFTNTGVFAEIRQVANSTARTSLVLAIDASNGYDITQEGGQLFFEYEIANATTVGLQIAYVPATHRWWRIRHVSTGDTIRFDTSVDGTAWSEQLSLPRPASLPVTALRIGMQAGTYVSVASPGVAIFDNLNSTTLTIFPTDSAALTDTRTVKGLILPITIADLVTLTDDRTVVHAGTRRPNVADAVTITDSAEAEMIAVLSDTVVVSDSAIVQRWTSGWYGTIDLLNMPHSAESVTLTDTVAFGGTPVPNVADAVTLTDTPTVRGLIPAIAGAETITLSDTRTVMLTDAPQGADTISVTDGVTVQGLIPAIAAAETVTLTDTVTVTGLILNVTQADTVTVVDDATVIRQIAGVWQIPAEDSLTLTDAATVTGLLLKTNVTDTLTLTDGLTLTEIYEPHAAETVTLTETVQVNSVETIFAAEAMTLTESVTVRGLILPMNVTDTLTLTDQGLVTLAVVIIRADTLSVSDQGTIRLFVAPRAAESLTVVDTAYVWAGFRGSDLLTLSDDVTIFAIGGVVTHPTVSIDAEVRDLTKVVEISLASVTAEVRDLTHLAAARMTSVTAEVRDLTKTIEVSIAQVVADVRDLSKVA